MAAYVQKGDVIDYTPGSAVAAGDVAVLGTIVGVATQAIAANELGALTIDGVFSMPCLTGSTGAAGDSMRWYAASGVADAATGVTAGYLVEARGAADTTVKVKLSH